MAETDEEFRHACVIAGQFPSRNRYRRFKHKRGLAYLLTHKNGKPLDNHLEKGIEIPTK